MPPGPKPTTRATAEDRLTNLERYKLGGFGPDATATIGADIKYNDSEPQGVAILGFTEDSSAEAAGLEEYDIILEVDGSAVGLIRGRYYEPWKRYGRSGIKKMELLVTYKQPDNSRGYYYPKLNTAAIVGERYVELPDDFFTVAKPRTRGGAETRSQNIARYVIGAGNFAAYAKYELGVDVTYSYEDGATVQAIKPGKAAAKAGIGLAVGDIILEVDGAPVGVFGDRTYEMWRQYAYSKNGNVELLVVYANPAGQWRYYYPPVQLDPLGSQS